ncbi:hypothetical protein STEG23_011915 [Scotinomys teguina]
MEKLTCNGTSTPGQTECSGIVGQHKTDTMVIVIVIMGHAGHRHQIITSWVIVVRSSSGSSSSSVVGRQCGRRHLGTRTAALRTESRMCRLSWFLDPGGWGKAATVGLYFIFPGICTLSLDE